MTKHTRCGLPTLATSPQYSTPSTVISTSSSPSVTGPMSTSAATTSPAASRVEGDDAAAGRGVDGRARARCRGRRGPRPTRGSGCRCRSSRRRRRRRSAASSCSRRRAGVAGPIVMSPSAPMPTVAVAEPGDGLGRERGVPAVEREADEEVVPGGVELGEVEQRSCAVGRDGRDVCSQSARTTRGEVVGISRGADPADPRVAPEPDPLAAGELPGAANRPGRRPRSSVGISPVEVGQDLLVPDRLRRGARQPPDPCRKSSEESSTTGRRGRGPRRRGRRRASRRTGRRCAGRARPAGSHTPTRPTSNAGGPYSASPAPNDENGRPVVSITSSARTIRRRVPGLDARRRERVGRGEPVVGARPARRRSRSRARARRAPRGRAAGRVKPVDHRPHVQPGPADEQRPPAARLDVGDRGRAPRSASSRTDHSSRRIGDVDEMVRNRGALGAATAWRCRCPCPGTPASSRARRSRRRRSARGDRERDRRLPRRGRTDDREVAGHTTATGMRTRRRGAGFDLRDEARRAGSAAPRS